MRIEANGIRIHYRIDGLAALAPKGEVSTVVLSHSLATSLDMWTPQVAALAARYRVLRYDSRGHGGTDVPDPPYSMDSLAEDLHALLGRLGIPRVHFLGLSLGGMVGQLFAARYPQMVRGLVLCDTSCRAEPQAGPQWEERIALARAQGMESLVEATIARWFTSPFVAAHPEVVDPVREMIRNTDPRGYEGCAWAVKTFDVADRLSTIEAPTLVMVGSEDPGTPVAAAQAIHEGISGAELVVLPSASHLSNLEQPETFSRNVIDFLDRVERQSGKP
jgi:3-oxoadipate enol-lactonase